MKTLFAKFVRFALLPTLFGAFFTFTSCDNDDPHPNLDGTLMPKFVYKAQVSSDLLLVADIIAVYQDIDGQQKSEPVTTTDWTKTFEGESLPATTGVTFNITKKADFDPTVGAPREYIIGGNMGWDVFVKNKQNQEIKLCTGNEDGYMETVTADGLDLALADINGSDIGLMVALGADGKPMCDDVDINWKHLDYIPKFNIDTHLSSDLLEIADVTFMIHTFGRDSGDEEETMGITDLEWSYTSLGMDIPEVLGFTFKFTKKANIDPEKTAFVIKASADLAMFVKGSTGDFVALPGMPTPESIDKTITAAEIDQTIADLNGGSWVFEVTPDKTLKVVVYEMNTPFEDLMDIY